MRTNITQVNPKIIVVICFSCSYFAFYGKLPSRCMKHPSVRSEANQPLQSTQTTDAVVIGAGAVGCAVALRLAQHGIIPHVIERDDIAANASGYAWGGLSAHFGSGVPGPMTKHYREAIDKHVEHYERVSREPEFDWQLQRVISMSLADNEKSATDLAEEVEWMRSEGFKAELISPDNIYEIEPAVRPGMIAASLVNAGWELDSYAYTRSLADECERYGATFSNGTATSVSTAGGKITSVNLNDQTCIETPLVVAATGPWVNQIKGIPELPIKPIKGEIIRLEREGNDLQHRVGFGGFNVGRKPDGSVWAGTYEWDRGFNRDVTEEGRNHIMNGVTHYIPSLAGLRTIKTTACLRPVASDGLPIVGASNAVDGLYYVNGAGKKGILLSLLMAEWLIGQVTHSIAPPVIVSPSRFGDM